MALKVDFHNMLRTNERVIVIVEGSGNEVADFIDWLEENNIDTVSYAEYFTGIPFRTKQGQQTFWCYMDDPDHEKRILIKLRWK